MKPLNKVKNATQKNLDQAVPNWSSNVRASKEQKNEKKHENEKKEWYSIKWK